MNSTAYFDVDTLASYLLGLKLDISPLKLNKTLYFLYAYYGAYYQQEGQIGVCEGSLTPAISLFEAEFEAWKSGPVIHRVYLGLQENRYEKPEAIAQAKCTVEQHPEVKKFIDDLFEQIDSVSDFQLMCRCHEDACWKQAYKQGERTIMSNTNIIQEYAERYVAPKIKNA